MPKDYDVLNGCQLNSISVRRLFNVDIALLPYTIRSIIKIKQKDFYKKNRDNIESKDQNRFFYLIVIITLIQNCIKQKAPQLRCF